MKNQRPETKNQRLEAGSRKQETRNPAQEKTMTEKKQKLFSGSRLLSLVSCLLLLASCFLLPISNLYAAEKTWNANEGETDWFEDGNWFPQEAPTSADDATISSPNATVDISQTFNAKSITVGGTQPCSLNIDNFVSGLVAPDANTDIAILNRRDGVIKIKGSAGTTKLKGTYKDSEESLADQPSFVFYVK